MESPATTLITRGAGFIGSQYVRMIAEDHPDWSIRVIVLLTYSGTMTNLESLEGRLSFIRSDIADPAVVDGQQLFACASRGWIQPICRTAGENDALACCHGGRV